MTLAFLPSGVDFSEISFDSSFVKSNGPAYLTVLSVIPFVQAVSSLGYVLLTVESDVVPTMDVRGDMLLVFLLPPLICFRIVLFLISRGGGCCGWGV